MEPDDDQKRRMFEHLRYEIESFVLDPIYDETNEALKESVLFRKMAHCRALYHFFKKKKRNKTGKWDDDDVLSNDFKFEDETLYGDQEYSLLDQFNKRLFHLTYSRLDYIGDNKRWATETLFPPVERQAKKFIEDVLAKEDLGMTDSERELWTKLKADIAGRNPLQQNTSNVAVPKHSILQVTPKANP